MLREQCVGLVELLNVVRAVVGREGDAGENDLCAGVLERADNLVQIGAGVFNAQPAQAVVAAEFDDSDGGVESEDFGEALDANLGGVAADAAVADAVVVVALIEVGLKVVGVTLARRWCRGRR